MHTVTTLASAILLTVTGPLCAADVQKETGRTYTNEQGNTVVIEKRATLKEDERVKRARQFTITDAQGETLAAGRDRDWQRTNGSHGSSQAGVKYDADGNRILKRRQVHENADGDFRARRGKAVRDEDGNLVARGIDGRASKDGVDYRSQKRTRVNANGETVTAHRQGSVDANGNRQVVKGKTTKGKQSGGSGNRNGRPRR